MTLNQKIDKELRLCAMWFFLEGFVCGIGALTVYLNWNKLFGG